MLLLRWFVCTSISFIIITSGIIAKVIIDSIINMDINTILKVLLLLWRAGTGKTGETAACPERESRAHVYMCIYVYAYIYIHMYNVCTHINTYIYI